MTVLLPSPLPGLNREVNNDVSDESWELAQVLREVGPMKLLEYVVGRCRLTLSNLC